MTAEATAVWDPVLEGGLHPSPWAASPDYTLWYGNYGPHGYYDYRVSQLNNQPSTGPQPNRTPPAGWRREYDKSPLGTPVLNEGVADFGGSSLRLHHWFDRPDGAEFHEDDGIETFGMIHVSYVWQDTHFRPEYNGDPPMDDVIYGDPNCVGVELEGRYVWLNWSHLSQYPDGEAIWDDYAADYNPGGGWWEWSEYAYLPTEGVLNEITVVYDHEVGGTVDGGQSGFIPEKYPVGHGEVRMIPQADLAWYDGPVSPVFGGVTNVWHVPGFDAGTVLHTQTYPNGPDDISVSTQRHTHTFPCIDTSVTLYGEWSIQCAGQSQDNGRYGANANSSLSTALPSPPDIPLGTVENPLRWRYLYYTPFARPIPLRQNARTDGLVGAPRQTQPPGLRQGRTRVL